MDRSENVIAEHDLDGIGLRVVSIFDANSTQPTTRLTLTQGDLTVTFDVSIDGHSKLQDALFEARKSQLAEARLRLAASRAAA